MGTLTTSRKQFRILITSLAAKIPLTKSLRKSLDEIDIELFIWGADTNPNCLGRHFTDAFWLMPRIDELTPAVIINFCQINQIKAVLPTRDGELRFFAKYRALFDEANIFVMVSKRESVESCFDKLAFYYACADYAIPTSQTLDDLSDETFVVKERFGAGSTGIKLNVPRDEARQFSSSLEHPIFQPWIAGQEYSVDVYRSRSGQVMGCIARSRDLIERGEASITTTARIPELETICTTLSNTLNLSGHVVFQAMIDNTGKIHIIECNCRFGGASSLSIAAGLSSPIWIYCEASGMSPSKYPFKRISGELKQIRYATDILITLDENHEAIRHSYQW